MSLICFFFLFSSFEFINSLKKMCIEKMFFFFINTDLTISVFRGLRVLTVAAFIASAHLSFECHVLSQSFFSVQVCEPQLCSISRKDRCCDSTIHKLYLFSTLKAFFFISLDRIIVLLKNYWNWRNISNP